MNELDKKTVNFTTECKDCIFATKITVERINSNSAMISFVFVGNFLFRIKIQIEVLYNNIHKNCGLRLSHACHPVVQYRA